MRLSEAKVDSLTAQIVELLRAEPDVDLHGDDSHLRVLVRQALLDELMVEDRLEDEVRQVLKQYDREIRLGRMSYNTLFTRIKAKLVRERNLVL